MFCSNMAANLHHPRDLGAQTHGDRVALHSGTLVLGLVSFWGHLGPVKAVFGPFWAHFSLLGPTSTFFAGMWPPTGTTRELGGQTHGDRVALHRGPFVLGLRPFWGHLGQFQAVFGPFWGPF